MERRYLSLPGLEVRLETRDDGKNVLTGHAAVFYSSPDSGTTYQLGPGLREVVMPTAFDRVLADKTCNVRALFNHNPDHLLGSRAAGTLRLAKTDKGLQYSADLPDTQAGRDVAEMCRRGDLAGSSFSFRVRKQAFVQGGKPSVPMAGDQPALGMTRDGDGDADDVRELHDVDVEDVGPVTFPAYGATTAGVRAADLAPEVRSAWQSWREERAGRKVQSVMIPKDKFSAAEAKKWCKDHDFDGPDPDETENFYRFRQFDPADCASEPRTITLSEKDGIKAVVCVPKEKKCQPPAPADTLAVMRMRQRLLEVE